MAELTRQQIVDLHTVPLRHHATTWGRRGWELGLNVDKAEYEAFLPPGPDHLGIFDKLVKEHNHMANQVKDLSKDGSERMAELERVLLTIADRFEQADDEALARMRKAVEAAPPARVGGPR